MAIEKEEVIGNKATALTYWRYGDLIRFVEHNDPQTGLPYQGAVVAFQGYSSEAAREAVKENGRKPDHTHEFLITNYVAVEQDKRPATIEEKQRDLPQYLNNPDFDWENHKHDIVLSETRTPVNAYDEFRSVYNTPKEKATVYNILKKHPNTATFFKDAKDIL